MHILGTDHQLFEKQSKKKRRDFTLIKRQLSEYVTKVIKNRFSNAILKSLEAALLVNIKVS